MKLNSIITNTSYLKGGSTSVPLIVKRESAKERENLKQVNKNQINTTIKSNSDGRASFKGSVPFLHKAANFASDNPLLAEALFAILITCLARPLTIMATAKNEEEKEKCSYQAAKSISSGLVGLVMTALVATPIAAATKLAKSKGAFKMPAEMKEQSQEVIKKGIDALTEFSQGAGSDLSEQIAKLTENGKINLSVFKKAGKSAEKLFKEKVSELASGEKAEKIINALKEQRVVDNYSSTAKNVADKMFQPIFMPLRATVTIAMVPLILKLLGLSKPGSTPKPKEQNPFDTLNYNVFNTNSEKELFQFFSEEVNNENK